MSQLIRDLHSDHVKHGAHDYVQDFVERTAAIVAELPDEDIAEARRVIVETYGPAIDDRLGDGPARVRNIRDGKADDYWEMRAVVAGIKRGRELARSAFNDADNRREGAV
jgi:hypothetical protein